MRHPPLHCRMPSPPSESGTDAEPGSSLPSPWWIVLLTGGGLLSGWISGRLVQIHGDDYLAERWVPGACFAAWTLVATWSPAGLAARPRVKRSPTWNLGIFAGVTCSYVAAYYVAYWVVMWLPGDLAGFSLSGSVSLTLGGLAGGAIGSAALVNLWSLLFSRLGDLRIRGVLITWGTLLGAFLAVSKPDYVLADWSPSPALFVTWQGSMALALCLADRFGEDPLSARA